MMLLLVGGGGSNLSWDGVSITTCLKSTSASIDFIEMRISETSYGHDEIMILLVPKLVVGDASGSNQPPYDSFHAESW